MRKLSKITLFFSLFLVLFSFNAFADSVAFNYPLGNETLNGTIILNATADYNCLNATFYYSNSSNPWQYSIGNNTTSGTTFTFIFDTNTLSDGVYNFTANVTNSTLEKFSTTTNITINNPPKWFNNISTPSGSQYSPGKLYQFNITWIDGNLSTILFESNYTLNGSASGSLYNYSNASNSSGIFWINLTDLPAQTFVYRWIANDTSGNLNSTGNLIYVIAKNSSFYLNLTLNGTESNRSYNINEIANFTATLNFTNKTVYLDSNCLSWVNLTGNSSIALNISNTTNLTCSGLFFIKAYWNGENYSEPTKTFYFDTTSPQYSILYPTNPSDSYDFNKTYWFNITWSDATLKQVYFEFNNSSSSTNLFNKTFNLNSSGLYWINNVTDYPSGDYNYKWCANDSLGNTNCTNNTNFSITKPSKIPSLSLSAYEIYEGNSTIVNCTKTGGDPSSLLNLYRNGTSYSLGSSNTSIIYTAPTTLGAGYYIWNCTIDASQNYSWWYNIAYLTIDSIPSTITPTPVQTPSGSFTLTPSSSSITIEPNSSDWITLTLKNTYSYNITNINITVSGINVSWYSLSKVNISVLQKNGGTDTSLLTLNIPDGAERKSYSIIASAAGRDPSGFRLTRQVSITLIVPVEAPQNVTNNTNETGVLNTTGIESLNNQTNVTGLSINIKEFADYIVLIIASVVIILIFIFRNEFTDFIRGKKPEAHPEHKVHEGQIIEGQVHKEQKKIHRIISHVKKKISSLSENKLVIQVKKKEKKEEEKT